MTFFPDDFPWLSVSGGKHVSVEKVPERLKPNFDSDVSERLRMEVDSDISDRLKPIVDGDISV